MNKINLLKNIDSLFGKPFIHLLSLVSRHSKEDYLKSMGQILFIRPGGIGDAVLLLPAVEELKLSFPDISIDVLCEKRNADIFRLSDKVNRVYLYDRGVDLLRCMKNRYNAVIDTEQWHRLSAVVARLTRATVRIGFDTNERKKLFTHKVSYSHDDYEVYSFFHLIEPIINEPPAFNPDAPFLPLEHDIHAGAFPALQSRDGRIVSIFPGASVPERRWGGERYGAVARTLVQDGYTIVVVGSEEDKPDAEKIMRFVPEGLDLTGRTTLKDVACILKKSELLITADSGLMHIAYAVGTPTVSIFGPGIEQKWAPRGKKHAIINRHLKCSPCTKFGYTPKCKIGVKCMKLIAVEDVLIAAKHILSRKE